jgi:hypothetical protein
MSEEMRSIIIEMLIVDEMLHIKSADDQIDYLIYDILSGEFFTPFGQTSNEDILLDIKNRIFFTDVEEFESWLEHYYAFELKGILIKPSLHDILHTLKSNKEYKITLRPTS